MRTTALPLAMRRCSATARLALYTRAVGLRVSEVVGVRTSEIDFDHGLIKIWDEKRDQASGYRQTPAIESRRH